MRFLKRPALAGTLCALLAAAALPGISHAQGGAPDSLMLLQPANFNVTSVYDEVRRSFVVWMTWEDPPDSIATFVHQPDTSGWAVTTPSNLLTLPSTEGYYTGDVDRSIFFRAVGTGQVGQPLPLEISYEVRREENLSGRIDIGSNYVPGTYLDVIFDDKNTPAIETIDFGFRLAFSAGQVDQQGGFLVGLEDYEGFHVWRGIESDGSDLEIIGEMSKEEAFIGQATGGSFADSVYYYDVLPTLRNNQTWFSPYGAVECLGTKITLPLASSEMFWWDCNAFNGFTYYYAITTFDRGYGVRSGRQGLQKVDNCDHTGGVPYECADELVQLPMEVDSQNDPLRIFVIPNPYRTGSSRLTTENYHNFPDDVVRFVNVPQYAQIKVFTLAGDLVWETTHQGGKGNVAWDTRNRGDQLVTSGVYIFRVELDDGNAMYGRLVIIR